MKHISTTPMAQVSHDLDQLDPTFFEVPNNATRKALHDKNA